MAQAQTGQKHPDRLQSLHRQDLALELGIQLRLEMQPPALAPSAGVLGDRWDWASKACFSLDGWSLRHFFFGCDVTFLAAPAVEQRPADIHHHQQSHRRRVSRG